VTRGLWFNGDEHEPDRCLDILLVDDAILIEVGKRARRIRRLAEH
jgi:hypothetical protein